jgi:hypothetical protein
MRPENLVWVFGTARTGSSWLSAIMGDCAALYPTPDGVHGDAQSASCLGHA